MSYNSRTKHQPSFYLATIEGLLSGIKAGLSDAEIATHLNGLGLKSPMGKPWTTVATVQALFKLRHYREVASRLHSALLQLTYDGLLTKAQCLPLFAQRHTQVQM